MCKTRRMTDEIEIRPYSADDFAAVRRIWEEIGWIEAGNDREAKACSEFLDAGQVIVATIDGSAECAVHRTGGNVRYLDDDLPLGVIGAVTTSRVARKRRLASHMTATALASAAAEGAAVGALGMFEQGFYDRIGFGTIGYEHTLTFDPASLRVDVPYRPPVRIDADDWEAVHAAMTNRLRGHGSVVLTAPALMRSELTWIERPFGLGYRTGDRITHFVYGSTKGEHGPYAINWIGYEEPAQLLELLRMLRELGDQVHLIRMTEPADIQLQDLIHQPMRSRQNLKFPPNVTANNALAWRQIRILDLPAAVAAFRRAGPTTRFNATITDPVAALLTEDAGWEGCGGEWTVTFGEASTATPGHTAGLPELTAGIGAFSRMWFGVRPASGLALTDDLRAPPGLLTALDGTLTLPTAHVGWDF